MAQTRPDQDQSLSTVKTNSASLILTNTNDSIATATAEVADPQVKPKRQKALRRTFNSAYKLQILAAYDACQNAQERGELLRREGLYRARIRAWRSQKLSKTHSTRKNKSAVRVDHLTRENEQLKKRLAQAEAIIELQKKVSDFLGMHILSAEKNEVSS